MFSTKNLSCSDIRNLFTKYFATHEHKIIQSSSLVTTDDPTLLFTNAGMVQFKNIFLGKETSKSKRAVTIQKCLRASGKHNDLENVGFTPRHHTFFEMLGNFSFGDYFKREAIKFAWTFLTDAQWLGIPATKLWITVHKNDEEAAVIWLNEIKIDPAHFSRCGDQDNFWAMGETGPCGYCSEIYFDHGEQFQGGIPESDIPDGNRYVELWNLVFMQFNRDAQGNLTPLPNPSIDTGMGLERVAAAMQGVHSNYEIDIFSQLITHIKHTVNTTADDTNPSLRVIADHIRTIAFLIADGVIPSNEGRGYVLRRIIRRAVRHANLLNANAPQLYLLIPHLIAIMGDAYPELESSQRLIANLLQKEEQQFFNTLEHGLKIFQQEIAKLSQRVIPGEVVFKLYDTYGFPVDLTADMAREHGLTIDEAGFTTEMTKQRDLSRAASQFATGYADKVQLTGATTFTGYEKITDTATITLLLRDDTTIENLNIKDTGIIILDKTPCYAESGGQIGDVGEIYSDTGRFIVEDTKRHGNLYLHYGRVNHGTFTTGQTVTAEVNNITRQAIAANHSATHLLHAALRQVLGNHYQVAQRGSAVDSSRLRFDFTYFEQINPQQLRDIERIVNQKIRANLPATTQLLTLAEAKQQGAIALFDEKYGDTVRVVSMGNFSKELCGGTHVKNTGVIGLFKIVSESSVATGVRRIEAITGETALNWFEQSEITLHNIAQLLKTNREQTISKIKQLLENQRTLEKDLAQLKQQLTTNAAGDLTAGAVDVNGIKVLAISLENTDIKTLRQTLDQLKQKMPTAVIVLSTINDGKIQLIVGVTKDCIDKINANELMQHLAKLLNGSGGGRPDLAQGGGSDLAALPGTLASVAEWVKMRP